MFEDLRRYNQIYVSGPQRSGTTICTKMIAHDTGFRFIDENEYGTFDFPRMVMLATHNQPCVVQCPSQSHRLVELSDYDTLIVFMYRNPEAIIASEKRIKWGFAEHQLRNYPGYHVPVCIAKTHYWEYHQKSLILNSLDVQYDTLRNHPLWVSPEARQAVKWGAKQTAL